MIVNNDQQQVLLMEKYNKENAFILVQDCKYDCP